MSTRTRRSRLGRFVTTIGFVWIFWAIITSLGLLSLQFGSGLATLPILPGFILLFLGRAIRRSGRSASDDDDQTVEDQQEAAQRSQSLPEQVPVYEPIRSAPERTVASRVEESEPAIEALIITDAIEGMDQEIVEIAASRTERKSSAEMVDDARKRFGKRP